jgi:hypothetical protein
MSAREGWRIENFGSQFASADQRYVAQLAAALSITNGLRRKETREAQGCADRRRHCCTDGNGFHALASEHMAGTSQAAGEVAHNTGEAVGIEDEWMRRRRKLIERVDGVSDDGSRGMRCADLVFVNGFVKKHGERRWCGGSATIAV